MSILMMIIFLNNTLDFSIIISLKILTEKIYRLKYVE